MNYPLLIQHKWWQNSLFRISMIFLGIFVGAYWSHILGKFAPVFLALFLMTALYLMNFNSTPARKERWEKKTKRFGRSLTDF